MDAMDAFCEKVCFHPRLVAEECDRFRLGPQNLMDHAGYEIPVGWL